MKIKFLILLVAIIPAIFSCTQQKTERETNFNANWKFIRADVESAELPSFDDSVGEHSIYHTITVSKIYPQKRA
jgi:hypothetical protein